MPPPAPKAFLTPNARFLEVEAATDRRVRTSSVVLKKNARLAPSVQPPARNLNTVRCIAAILRRGIL